MPQVGSDLLHAYLMMAWYLPQACNAARHAARWTRYKHPARAKKQTQTRPTACCAAVGWCRNLEPCQIACMAKSAAQQLIAKHAPAHLQMHTEMTRPRHPLAANEESTRQSADCKWRLFNDIARTGHAACADSDRQGARTALEHVLAQTFHDEDANLEHS